MNNCRHCNTRLDFQLIDLGETPPSNAYLLEKDLELPERRYPLRVMVCSACWLVQTQDFVDREIMFDDSYAYFSSASESWLSHSKRFAEMIKKKLKLTKNSFVVEIASNDGYLLDLFHKWDIPCLGIEPTKSTADIARGKGLNVIEDFFGTKLAKDLYPKFPKADLVVANNVFAHVPDINDFANGLKSILAAEGIISLEFPHLLELIKFGQFDTIYHEHYSYLSLRVVQRILEKVGLKVISVEQLKTHGGSLRVLATHYENKIETSDSVQAILNLEVSAGLEDFATYSEFAAKAENLRAKLKTLLSAIKDEGRTLVGYGAAAKGNTLLNFAGITTDLLPVVFEISPSKVGKYLPGSRIPILESGAIARFNPDIVIILPWNLQSEILLQLSRVLDSRTLYLTVIPQISFSNGKGEKIDSSI